MPEELARRRVCDDRALVADHRLGAREVRTHRLVHPSRHDDHANAARAGGVERGARARAQGEILPDQRPVEVARDRRDVARKVVREVQCAWVRKAVMSAICLSVSCAP